MQKKLTHQEIMQLVRFFKCEDKILKNEKLSEQDKKYYLLFVLTGQLEYILEKKENPNAEVGINYIDDETKDLKDVFDNFIW